LGSAARADDAGEFVVNSAHTRLQNNLYLLDADITYRLSGEVIDALLNGVTIILELRIEVNKKRWYAWDVSVAELRQRYQLKYHMLTNQYMLTWLNTGVQENFAKLDTAMRQLGKLMDFPLLDAHLVENGEHYQVYLQTWLDIEALPAPLRPVAYFSPQWRLTSNRYTCPLEPS
jgi:hypothetical protein